MLREEYFRPNKIESVKEKPGGIRTEKYWTEFIESYQQEQQEKGQMIIFEKIEPTKKNGLNDRNQIDLFAHLRGGLSCAIDGTGLSWLDKRISPEAEERLKRKETRHKMISFICRRDEITKKAVSEPMPHFVIDGLNLEYWIELGKKVDEEGIPITDLMTEAEQNRQYMYILGKMWEQIGGLLKNGIELDRRRIRPYKTVLENEYRRILSKKELEVLGIRPVA